MAKTYKVIIENIIACAMKVFDILILNISKEIRQKINIFFRFLQYIFIGVALIFIAIILSIHETSQVNKTIITIIIFIITLKKILTGFLVSSAKDEAHWINFNNIYIPIHFREKISCLEEIIEKWAYKPQGPWRIGLKFEDKIIFKIAGFKEKKLYLSAKLIDEQSDDVDSFVKYYLAKESTPISNPLIFPFLAIVILIYFISDDLCVYTMTISIVLLFRIVALSLIKEISDADLLLIDDIGLEKWKIFLNKSKNYDQLYGIYTEDRNLFSNIIYYMLAFPFNLNSERRETFVTKSISEREGNDQLKK